MARKCRVLGFGEPSAGGLKLPDRGRPELREVYVDQEDPSEQGRSYGEVGIRRVY